MTDSRILDIILNKLDKQDDKIDKINEDITELKNCKNSNYKLMVGIGGIVSAVFAGIYTILDLFVGG